MKLTSAAFPSGGTIPKRHTCGGEDVSPPLSWSGLPEATKSLALIVDDPDAPVGVWIHWVLYDLPLFPAALAEGRTSGTPGASWGVDSFARKGWSGPCPPPGKPHRYVFTLYALSGPTGLKPGATKAEVLKAIAGKTLGKAELIGLYGR